MEPPKFQENYTDKCWDVIVVGTGMGGATIGYALAKSGLNVLFCEKGKSYLSSESSLRGDYAEHFFSRPECSQVKQEEIMSLSGRWSEEIEDISAARSRTFVPFIGLGTGGSSALYGMALERFFPSDFAPKRHYPNAEGATVPEQWPITYEELVPYYEAAERLYRVRGTADTLRDAVSMDHFLAPQPLTPVAEELHGFLLAKGLHPYRLPVGCEFASGCECCQSYLCDKNCKNDSARICLLPAIADFGAQLFDECDVIRLESDRNAVTGVVCSWHGRQVTLRGKVIVIAAGALETPRILLSSASSTWPKGLANDSGLVGKNLMRHYIDLYAIVPKTQEVCSVNFKEIAFNDFYVVDGQKFGTVQSFGAMPPSSILVKGMEQELKGKSIPLLPSLFRLSKPALKTLLARIFSQRIVLATIMEDLPYRNNLITISDETDTSGRRRLILNYQLSDHERARVMELRKKLADILSPYSFMLIKQAENNERIAHACGTCRFGTDQNESVLDANNRAHGLTNLYVVDASFFPTSGGTNPALTIAANALRVADRMLERSR